MANYIKYNNRMINLDECFEIKSYIDKNSTYPITSFITNSGHTAKFKFNTVEAQDKFLAELKGAIGSCMWDIDILLKNQKRRGNEDV